MQATQYIPNPIFVDLMLININVLNTDETLHDCTFVLFRFLF